MWRACTLYPAADPGPDHRRRKRPDPVPGLGRRRRQRHLVNEWARKLTTKIGTLPELRTAVTDAGATGAAAFIDIDRDTASRLSITAASIDDALYSAYGQRIVSTIFTETNQYRVILEAQQDKAMSIAALGRLQLRTGSGQSTPLSAVATISERQAPLQVIHVAQYPAATVGFDTAAGASLGDAVAAIRAAAVDLGMPASVSMTFLGASGAYQSRRCRTSCG